MTVKSISYLPAANYAYPATYHDLAVRTFDDVLRMLMRAGYRCIVYKKTRAIMEHYSGRQVERRYIAIVPSK